MAKQKTDKASTRLDLKGQDIDAIIAQLNEKYGANSIIRASQAVGLKLHFSSTGVYALDFVLGGGFPRNRITEINGNFSALKSTVINSGIYNFQQAYPNGYAVMADFEHSFDPQYAAKFGVDLKRLLVINPDCGEQGIDMITETLSMDRELFLFIDSIAAIIPSAELEASAMQSLPAIQARLVNKLIRQLIARLKRGLYDNSVPGATIVCTNQIREKVGIVFGNPEVTPGGRGKDFAYSIIVKFSSSPSKAIKETIKINGIERVIRFGQLVTFSINKNKCGRSQYEDGEFEFYVRPFKGHKANTFSNAETLFRLGAFYDILTAAPNKKGVIAYSYIAEDGTEIGPYTQESAFVKALLEGDSSIERELYSKILSAAIKAEDEDAAIDVESGEPVEEPAPAPKRKIKLAK